MHKINVEVILNDGGQAYLRSMGAPINKGKNIMKGKPISMQHYVVAKDFILLKHQT